MSWIRIGDEMPRHPAWVGSSDALLGGWLRAACYSSEQHLDGNLPASYVRSMPTRTRDELLERGRLHKPGEACSECVTQAIAKGAAIRSDHYYLHALLQRNPSTAEKDQERESTRRRVEEWRKRRNGVPR